MIYFNTSTSQSGNDKDFNSACKGAGGPKNGTVCWINDKSGVDSEDSKVTLSSADSISRSRNLVLVAGVGLAALLLVWT